MLIHLDKPIVTGVSSIQTLKLDRSGFRGDVKAVILNVLLLQSHMQTCARGHLTRAPRRVQDICSLVQASVLISIWKCVIVSSCHREINVSCCKTSPYVFL